LARPYYGCGAEPGRGRVAGSCVVAADAGRAPVPGGRATRSTADVPPHRRGAPDAAAVHRAGRGLLVSTPPLAHPQAPVAVHAVDLYQGWTVLERRQRCDPAVRI